MEDVLKMSILIEDQRKRLRECTEALKQKNTALEVMAEYITESLEAFEAIFNVSADLIVPEQMARYIVAASYMEARYGRKSIVKQVERKLRSLKI